MPVLEHPFRCQRIVCWPESWFQSNLRSESRFQNGRMVIKTNMSIVTKARGSGYQLDRSCEAVRYMPGMLFQHLVLCRSERMYLHG